MSINFWIILAVTAGLVFIAVVLLCVGIILRKDHSFRSQHITENERMKQDKIHCAASQAHERPRRNKINVDEL
jgi:uncharacterized membrane protein